MYGKIYKITNIITNQIYVGKTKNSLDKRLKEHIQDAKTHHDNTMLHNAMNKYGYKNFKIDIVEDNIPLKKLNEKEKFYIKKLKAHKRYGNYNLTDGGDGGVTWSKLTKDEVKEIWNILLYASDPIFHSDIAKQYNVDCSTISAINRGVYWHNSNFNYPLRKTKKHHKHKMFGKENPKSRAVLCVELNKTFESIRLANSFFHVKQSHIGQCCQGQRKTALGYHWKYIENKGDKNELSEDRKIFNE